MAIVGVPAVYLAYALAFGLAVGGCGVGLLRALQIDDRETRRGLVGLLAASGCWAAFELGFLVAPSPRIAYWAYVASLVVGLATIGAWLYFCSAYTGRVFHRDRRYGRLAVATYLAIVGVKLTNPIHGLYFQTEVVTVPFNHLTIMHGTLHWLVTGLSYALAAVGFFMLYEAFLEADYDTRPLAALVGVTSLPVVLDIAGFASPWLIDINHEPLGVAVFAVGALYAFEDRFLAVQLTDGVDDPVVYLDDDDQIREVNERAASLFPSLADATGAQLAAVLPGVADRLGEENPIVERVRDGEPRYYLVSDTPFALGGSSIGRLLVFTDVTETERKRRELARHNEQLEGFAAAIRHELLNTLQMVDGYVTVAGEAVERGNVNQARESLVTASEEADRMERIVDDLADLARYGKTPDRIEEVSLAETARAAHESAAVEGLALSVEGDVTVPANQPRLRDLFESAYEFAAHNGASTVTVTPTDDGFAIADDGDPVAGDDPEDFFSYGDAVPNAKAGLALPNVRMLARTQGYDAEIDPEYEDGVRVRVVCGADTEVATAAEGVGS